jgi:hypothetical protein
MSQGQLELVKEYDPLHVDHFADAAIVGEGVGDDKFLRADRFVVSENSKLAVSLDLAVFSQLRCQRTKALGARFHQGIKAAPAGSGRTLPGERPS